MGDRERRGEADIGDYVNSQPPTHNSQTEAPAREGLRLGVGSWRLGVELLRLPQHFALAAVLIHDGVRHRAARVHEELDLRVDNLEEELRLRLCEHGDLLLSG